MVRSVEVLFLQLEDILFAGGKESLLSTPADTHSHSQGRGPVEADSETDNSHAETTGRHTGMYVLCTCTAGVNPLGARKTIVISVKNMQRVA